MTKPKSKTKPLKSSQSNESKLISLPAAPKKRKIILDKGQSPGDILVFTTVLRDLIKQYPDWDIDVRSCCMEIFENNPYLTPLAEGAPGVEYHVVQYDTPPGVHQSGNSGMHFSNAYYVDLEKRLGVKIEQTELLPEIYLSQDEKNWVNQVKEDKTFGYKGKFWLINAGNKNDYTLKQWGFDNWQQLVNLLKGLVQFVQVGEYKEDGSHFHPKLRGVLSLVGQTNLRELIRLAYHAEGTVTPVSFLMHLSAAFRKPCVVLAGGREPPRWEYYPNHQYMSTNGMLSCCAYDGCWLDGRIKDENGKQENVTCKNLVGSSVSISKGPMDIAHSRCMAMIEPLDVSKRVMGYVINNMPLHSKIHYEIIELERERKVLENKNKQLQTKKDLSKIESLKILIKNLEDKREKL